MSEVGRSLRPNPVLTYLRQYIVIFPLIVIIKKPNLLYFRLKSQQRHHSTQGNNGINDDSVTQLQNNHFSSRQQKSTDGHRLAKRVGEAAFGVFTLREAHEAKRQEDLCLSHSAVTKFTFG
jgi:hypothetical protein